MKVRCCCWSTWRSRRRRRPAGVVEALGEGVTGFAIGDAVNSVGLATIDVVNHIGAVPIAATRTEAKKQRLLDAGAAHVIVTDDESVAARTKEITGGRGAEFVFDAVAGEGVRELAAATAKGGTLVVYGALDAKETPFPLWFVPTMRLFNAFDLTLDPDRLARAPALRPRRRPGGDLPAARGPDLRPGRRRRVAPVPRGERPVRQGGRDRGRLRGRATPPERPYTRTYPGAYLAPLVCVRTTSGWGSP